MEKTIYDGIKKLPEVLLPWYEKAARDLPWRKTKNPYHVWVSEIMLQQTRVEAVKSYYTRFIDALPNVSALAEVEDAVLLKLWEGLGYYTRARNLKKAALFIKEKHGGVFPTEYKDILALPGIGEYTAGAIASICYEKPTPAVDGNVLRVVARVAELFAPVYQPAIKKQITNALAKCYPKEKCGEFTQSLMELGATVCVPNKAPNCAICPARTFCKAFQNQSQNSLPLRPEKKERKKEKRTVFLLQWGEKVAICKRQSKGLLGGMWEFPNTSDALSKEQATAYLKKQGVEIADIVQSAKAKHIFTHIEWDMTCYVFTVQKGPDQYIWVEKETLASDVALPTAFRQFCRLLGMEETTKKPQR